MNPYHAINMAEFHNHNVYDYTRELWYRSIVLAQDLADGKKAKKVYCWSARGGVSIYPLTKQDLVFGSVSSGWALLADYRYWASPVPTFMRLACMWQFKDMIDTHTKDACSKVGDEFADAVKWTFWLNSQGIRHLNLLVGT